MKNLSCIILCILFCMSAVAQNLVPNCSFEQYTNCPTGPAQAANCTGWSLQSWGSSDFLTTCNGGFVGVPTNNWGNQSAAHGNNYMGLYMFIGNNPTPMNKEYIKTSITPLQIGATYEVSMSVSLADKSGYGSNDLGAWFYDNGPNFFNTAGLIPVAPQASFSSYGPITDSINWTRLVTTFVADSAYDNIVIGGFKEWNTIVTAPASGTHACYYYIDSVVVKLVTNISVNATDTVFCGGDTIAVPFTTINSGSFNAGNIFRLQLSNANGSFSSPLNIGTLMSTTAGTIKGVLPDIPGNGYRLRIIGTNPADTSALSRKNIVIKTRPLPTAGSNSPICDGGSLSLYVTSLNGSTFAWTGPGSYTSTQQAPAISNATLAHAGDYIVTATLNGCSATDTIPTIVNPLPAAPTVSNNGPLCIGENLILNSQSTTANILYNWTGPNSYTSVTQSPIISNVQLSHGGAYSVTASLNGCTSAAAITLVTIKPTPPIPVAMANNILCNGSPLNLNTNNIPGATFSWTGPNGFTANIQNPTINPAYPVNAGTYYVNATVNGCVSDTDSVIVTVNFIPKIGGYASPNDTICQGTLTTFVAMQNNGGPTPVFQWHKNYSPIAGANSLLYSTSNLVTGDIFYCTMYSTGVCTDPITVSTDTIQMTVLPVITQPSATITSVPAKPQPNELTTFTAHVANGGPLPKYQWQVNGVDQVGATYATWSASTLRSFDKVNVIITSNDPCANIKTASSDTIMIGFATGISSVKSNDAFNLYPNPNNGNFKLTGSTMSNGPLKVEIVDAIGEIVYYNTHHPINNRIDLQLNLGNIANGIYLLKISDASNAHSFRFTVTQ